MGLFSITEDDYRRMIEHVLVEGEEFELGMFGNTRKGMEISLSPLAGFRSHSYLYMFVTNKRVIQQTYQYGLFKNGKDTSDILYEDISNVRLHKGILASDIYLKPRLLGDDMFISWVDNNIAEKAATLIRNHISDVNKQNKEKQQIVIQSNNNIKVRICPKCGWQNDRDNKFCGDCGFAFGIK